MTDYRLGRRFWPDSRDQNYPLRALLAAAPSAAETRGWRYWRDGPLLDQGRTSTCVGQAWRNWLAAAPIMDKVGVGPDPYAIYDAAIKVDEWPANDNDVARQQGTSVRAGAKVLQALGFVASYHWAATAEEVFAWLLTGGTIVAGTVWREGMFTVDKGGMIHPTGQVVGGHAYLLDGASKTRGVVRLYNSWGKWGRNGHAWLAGEDLATLLADQGEACAAVEQKVAP